MCARQEALTAILALWPLLNCFVTGSGCVDLDAIMQKSWQLYFLFPGGFSGKNSLRQGRAGASPQVPSYPQPHDLLGQKTLVKTALIVSEDDMT